MESNTRRIEAVALDAMGVIYPVADDLRDMLIPFLRRRGSQVPDERIIEAYRACYRNGASASTIWRASGCEWADGALEREFLACYELNPGAIEFLEEMSANDISVYGLSNDISEWAVARRSMLGMDAYFAGWVVSSDVRVTKPQPEIYRHLTRMLSCAPQACVFVDDRPENLVAAKDAGLQTVLFGSEPADDAPALPDFAALTNLVLSRK